MSWNGTGSGAGIRRSAALGDKRVLGVHPASREEALVADYRAPEDFTNTMAIKGGGGGGGGGKVRGGGGEEKGGGGAKASNLQGYWRAQYI